MALITNTALGDALILKEPSGAVVVPVLEFFTLTVTPIIGFPLSFVFAVFLVDH
jgi:hypothetical protein